ncbi:2-acyl-glycerophospho-ethanolamine acyltransferase [Enhygromyxa salina]|uniref:2-acyl-glycerophospho-ethanolamine acyltransferase n=1 Tax=Enhygromyxa salina TaxID=215803 RepID=A0A2S9XC40_9BACT|nr:1-acyl-sn-glycerol-3-phosphate acyltransferase [Enhygromyxa salina]PRP90422.1 2-acyl-glycerophospho-ethanolamine acyltransferase [Enhygromyxa salina]
MRATLTLLCRLLLRIFFRRVEAVGAQRVPSDRDRVQGSGPSPDPRAALGPELQAERDTTPVLYVLNHPNALLDPLFILCMSPRPVTFLAKAPLFSTVVVKHFVRAFECLPVYRKQDGADTSKNRASIEASIALLGSGKALALFPEGISHSGPKLAPLKTGAARIALAASASPSPSPSPSSAPNSQTPEPVRIVPVGICYDDKTRFRSDALLVYGEPLTTPQVELDERARPPEAAAEALTARITAALEEVTLSAQTHEAVTLARSAARILAAAERDAGDDPPQPDPLAGFDLERRLVAGYEQLCAREPGRVARVVARVRRFEGELARLGVAVDHPPRLARRRAARYTLGRLLSLTLLLGPAVVGLTTHFVPYRVIDWLAHRVAREQSPDGTGEDVLATLKLIGGFLLFPLTWFLLALALGFAHSWRVAGVGLVAAPLSGYAALRFIELLTDFIDRARGAWVLATRRDVGRYLASERAAIRAEIISLANRL